MKYFVKKVNNEVAFIKNGKCTIFSYDDFFAEIFSEMHTFAIIDSFVLDENVITINKVDYYTGKRYKDEIYLEPALLECKDFMAVLNAYLGKQKIKIDHVNMESKAHYWNGEFDSVVSSYTNTFVNEYDFDFTSPCIENEEVAAKVHEQFMNPDYDLWKKMNSRLKKLYIRCASKFPKSTSALVASNILSVIFFLLCDPKIEFTDFFELTKAYGVAGGVSILTGYFARKSFNKETDKALAHIADSVASAYICDTNPEDVFGEPENRAEIAKLTK